MAARKILLLWYCAAVPVLGACDGEDQCVSSQQPDSVALLQQSKQKGTQLGRSQLGRDRQSSSESHGSLMTTGMAEAGSQPVMKDVMCAFRRLAPHGSLLQALTGPLFPEGYNQGHIPYTEHFQGIQRQQDDHYLYISGSGKTEGQAQLFTLEMASSPTEGLLGTNGQNATASKHDVVVNVDRFQGGKLWHAGGFSSFGNYIAIGAESGCDPICRVLDCCKHESKVMFFDTSVPRAPVLMPYTVERPTATAGAVALTQEADGTFLLLVGRVDTAVIDFYRSSSTSLSSDPGFSLIGTWYKESLLVAAGQTDKFESYQTLNFVWQADGSLFMIGTASTLFGLGSSLVDLFTVEITGAPGPATISIKKVGSKAMKCVKSTCSFAAGAGAYVLSADTLAVYATDWEPVGGTIYINEFHSRPKHAGR